MIHKVCHLLLLLLLCLVDDIPCCVRVYRVQLLTSRLLEQFWRILLLLSLLFGVDLGD